MMLHTMMRHSSYMYVLYMEPPYIYICVYIYINGLETYIYIYIYIYIFEFYIVLHRKTKPYTVTSNRVYLLMKNIIYIYIGDIYIYKSKTF